MHLSGLTIFFIILIFWTDTIICQQFSYESCHVWGDPHLLMFPVHVSQADMRASYWCQSPGRLLILKNKYIEISVDVTTFPYYNENYEIKLFNGPTPFCTITHQNPSCTSVFVKVEKIEGTLSIDYYDADMLNVIVSSYMVGGGHSMYNIMITQSYELILKSSGLCVTKQPACKLENAAKPLGRRRKRALDRNLATSICSEYMQEAYKIAQDVMGNRGSKMAEHARAACINDVSTAGDPLWGQSAIDFVVMDALQQAQLKSLQRLERLKVAVPAITKAASVVRNKLCGSFYWNGTRENIDIPTCNASLVN